MNGGLVHFVLAWVFGFEVEEDCSPIHRCTQDMRAGHQYGSENGPLSFICAQTSDPKSAPSFCPDESVFFTDRSTERSSQKGLIIQILTVSLDGANVLSTPIKSPTS